MNFVIKKDITPFFIYAFFFVLLSACSFLTIPIYEYGIILILFFGLIISLLNYKVFCQYYKQSKVNFYLICFFLTSLCITTLINYNKNLSYNVVVSLFAYIYMFILMHSHQNSICNINKHITIFFKLISIYTNFMVIIGLVMYFLKCYGYLNIWGVKYNYGVGFRSAGFIQLIGIYTSVSTAGLLSSLSIIISFFYLLFFKREKTYWLITIILNFVFLSLTSNMTSILATMAVVFLLFFLITERKSAKHNYMSILKSAFVAFCITAIVFSFFRGTEYLSQKYYSHQEITSEQNKSIGGKTKHNFKSDTRDISISFSNGGTGRVEIWKAALNQWKSQPIFGVGYKNINLTEKNKYGIVRYYNTHNGYLAVLLADGAIGFVIIAIFMIRIFFTSLNTVLFKTNNKYYISIYLLTVYLLIFNLAQSQFIMERSIPSLLLFIFLGYIEKFYIEEKKEAMIGISKFEKAISNS